MNEIPFHAVQRFRNETLTRFSNHILHSEPINVLLGPHYRTTLELQVSADKETAPQMRKCLFLLQKVCELCFDLDHQ